MTALIVLLIQGQVWARCMTGPYRYSDSGTGVDFYSGSQVGVRGAMKEPHPRPLSKKEGSLMTSTPS